MAVHENTRNRAMDALREVTVSAAVSAGRCARAFIGLAFVLACIPVEQRALGTGETP